MNKNYIKKINVDNDKSYNCSILDIDSRYDNYFIDVYLNKNSKIIINLSVLNSTSNKNVSINIHHNDNDSYSECNCYGIAKQSSINFNVNSTVQDKTNGNQCIQKIKGLILDNVSKIAGTPNLTIDTNKVKASHTLTIGSFKQDTLFYLMSKGISEKDAKMLLSKSFYSDHLDKIADDDKIKILNKKIERFFNHEL